MHALSACVNVNPMNAVRVKPFDKIGFPVPLVNAAPPVKPLAVASDTAIVFDVPSPISASRVLAVVVKMPPL